MFHSWAAASDPCFWPQNWNRKLIATSLATEPWRDGKWLRMIDIKGLHAYDQAGSLFGHVEIYDNELSSYIDSAPALVDYELNLPGLRKRVWGTRENNGLYRLAMFTGAVCDGSVFEIGASSGKFGLTQ